MIRHIAGQRHSGKPLTRLSFSPEREARKVTDASEKGHYPQATARVGFRDGQDSLRSHHRWGVSTCRKEAASCGPFHRGARTLSQLSQRRHSLTVTVLAIRSAHKHWTFSILRVLVTAVTVKMSNSTREKAAPTRAVAGTYRSSAVCVAAGANSENHCDGCDQYTEHAFRSIFAGISRNESCHSETVTAL